LTGFVLSSLVVYLYFNDSSYFLSYFIGGVSTIFIIFSSFYSYQKSILQNASDSDLGQTKKQKQKDYKNIALSTNIKYKDIAKISKANKAKNKNKDKKSNKKAKKKLDKKQDKLQKHFNQAVLCSHKLHCVITHCVISKNYDFQSSYFGPALKSNQLIYSLTIHIQHALTSSFCLLLLVVRHIL